MTTLGERGLSVRTLLSDCAAQVELLKEHITQHSSHTGHIIKANKTIEIQLVRPTEVCGKV